MFANHLQACYYNFKIKQHNKGAYMNKTVKRILAIISICLLLALYVTTLVSALIGSDASINLFRACIYGTITIPILLWIFISIFKHLKKTNEVTEESSEEKN
jgi:high-affinity Fe2+/Pb2+ permease